LAVPRTMSGPRTVLPGTGWVSTTGGSSSKGARSWKSERRRPPEISSPSAENTDDGLPSSQSRTTRTADSRVSV
jgi:hypothetical protein